MYRLMYIRSVNIYRGKRNEQLSKYILPTPKPLKKKILIGSAGNYVGSVFKPFTSQFCGHFFWVSGF